IRISKRRRGGAKSAASLLVGLRRGGGRRSTRGRSRGGCRTGRGARRCTGSGAFGAGRNAGFGGGSRSSSGGSGRFGGGLELFGVAGRRHDGHQRDVTARDDFHVRRQRDGAQVLGVIDVEFGNIDVDRFRNGVGRAQHVDGVGDDVDRAAALDAGRLIGVEHVDGDLDANGGAFR